MAKSLRDRLVETAMEWQEKYSVSPRVSPIITPAIAEYDAARIIGISEEEYAELERDRQPKGCPLRCEPWRAEGEGE